MLRAALALAAVCALAACDSAPTTPEPKLSRFNGVKREQGTAAAKSFCEVTFPSVEAGSRAFALPAEKPVPGYTAPAASSTKGWRWVNLWATWCRPCVEEIGLLGKWQSLLAKDGLPIALDLYSVDDDEPALTGWMQKTKMPGHVRWLKGGAADLPAVLESLGVDKNAPIPVHALVDANDRVRCVRTGSVHDEDYGAVKAILAGG